MKFDSQHPHGGLQASITPVPGIQSPLLAPAGRRQIHTDKYAQNTYTYLRKGHPTCNPRAPKAEGGVPEQAKLHMSDLGVQLRGPASVNRAVSACGRLHTSTRRLTNVQEHPLPHLCPHKHKHTCTHLYTTHTYV